MPLPRPEPGVVIHYDYLWRNEKQRGIEAGEKRRPCVIVVAVTQVSEAETEVVVAPITHLEPAPPSEGILLPPRVKRYLALDAQPSWVITTDLNVFLWPGIDIHPVPRTPPGTYVYGELPPRLFAQIRDRIAAVGSIPFATRRGN